MQGLNGKIKFLTVAVILIFGAWVLYQYRLQKQPVMPGVPVAAAKPAPKPVVRERFVPGVHY